MTGFMANQIKILRKAKGVTQEEMGTALGISYQAISKWENDTALPDIQMIPKIAEYFNTNSQIAKIGEYFADCIRENYLEFDTLVGLAYHGIAFSSATATTLFNKYGVTVNYCYDRKVPDSRGRTICGHSLQNGERVVIIDDVMTTGVTLEQRIDSLKSIADINVVAVIVVVNRKTQMDHSGEDRIRKKYDAEVYSIITDEDINAYIR